MLDKSMGEIISDLRKEKGLTQKELADIMNVTDKAVSKWERDISCPDTLALPKLAEILDASVEDLIGAKTDTAKARQGVGVVIHVILRAIPLAMGIAVAVTSILGKGDVKSSLIMLGLGMASMAIYLLKEGD